MTPKHAILKSNGIVECWETERPRPNGFNSFNTLHDRIREWESSKKEYKCYGEELNNLLSNLFTGKFPDCMLDAFVQQQLDKGIDVTGLVEVKYIGDTEEQAVFFLLPNVETERQENQTTLAIEIISIVKNHEGSGTPLFELLTKYEFKTRK